MCFIRAGGNSNKKMWLDYGHRQIEFKQIAKDLDDRKTIKSDVGRHRRK